MSRMSELGDIAAAHDPDWRVRLRAVRLLSSRQDPTARRALEGLLSDSDTAVVTLAVNETWVKPHWKGVAPTDPLEFHWAVPLSVDRDGNLI
jgi:hypothetical protein